MSRAPDVLDRNLARLLTRAYVPIAVNAAFRTSLAARLRARAAAGAATPARPASSERPAPRPVPSAHAGPAERPRAPRTLAWQLAAALLVCALGGVFVARAIFGGAADDSPQDCAQLVARGDVAVRTEGAAWRAFDARERAHGLEHASGALELATPHDRGANVWLAGAGSAAFEAQSRASLALGADGGTLALDLEAGALALERLAAGGAWRVHTSQGDFELTRGKLELAYVGPELAAGSRSVRAKLVWGAARRLATSGSIELAAGDATIVRAPTAGALAPLASADTETRTNAAAGPAAAPRADTSAPAAPPDAQARLRAHVALPGGSALRAPWRLSVLRAVRLPDVGRPATHTFAADALDAELTELVPGEYELFATLPGFGDWRARDVVLAAGESLAIVITPRAAARASGRVLDARTGAPIDGAWIVSETDAPAAVLPFDFAADPEFDWNAWSCLARTGPDGRFELQQLSAGRHVLRVTASGHGASWSEPLELDAGASADGLVVRLGDAGRIVATLSSAKLPSATPRDAAGPCVIASRVDLEAQHRCFSFGFALDAPGGRAEIGDLAPGLYVVFEIARGRASPSMQQVVVRAGEETRVAFDGGERGARLHGTLRLAGGAPAAGIDLSLMPSRGAHVAPGAGASWINERSDGAGRFEFPALAPGTYEIYAGRGVGTQFALQGTCEVPDVNEFAHDIVLGAGELAGVAVRADDGAALANASILLEREENGGWSFAGRYATDALGRWHAEFVPLGRVRAAAYASAGRLAPAAAGPFELAPGASVDVRFALVAGAELALTVRDASGAALANVALEFVAADGSRQHFSRDDATDASGRFVVDGIAAGAWTIRANREGFAPLERTIELYAGDRRALELVLARTADERSGATRPR